MDDAVHPYRETRHCECKCGAEFNEAGPPSDVAAAYDDWMAEHRWHFRPNELQRAAIGVARRIRCGTTTATDIVRAAPVDYGLAEKLLGFAREIVQAAREAR